MYSQSIPRVEMEWDGLARDLDARFDPRVGRPMNPSVRSARGFGVKDDPVVSNRPWIGRRIFRTLTRFPIAVLIGVGATLAWQSHGDAARDMVVAEAPSLGWLLSVETTKSPAMPATAPDQVVQQLEPLAFNLDVVRRSVEQLAAKQEQMTENLATLQAVADDIRQRMSTPPPSSPPQQQAALPQHKPSPRAQSSAAPRPQPPAGSPLPSR
jgi:hypothetical protein